MNDVQFHQMDDGRRIAFRHTPGKGPTLVFLPGYMSDMDGGKATSLFARAQEAGRSCLLLDYSGCGQSSGEFADGSLSLWREEVLELIDGLARQGEIAGIDLVEVAPDYDPSGSTQILAAQLLLNFIGFIFHLTE